MINLRKTTLTATLGGLLADVGEPAFRASGAKNVDSADFAVGLLDGLFDRTVIDCAKLLHRDADSLPDDSPVFAVKLADRVASGTDRAASPGQKKIPLSPLVSLFSTMKGEYGKYVCPTDTEQGLPLPTEKKGSSDSGALARLSEKLSEALKDSHGGGVESITRIVERYLSGLPDNILSDAPKDISIYDHSKLRAALSACIVEYCEDSGIHDLKSVLSDAGFMSRDAFLMYSCDISGIQSFIYNITSSGALRSLRGRSFALEMLMEHFIDELLMAAGLSRANLIYSGGGHCYILLPNTGSAKEAADDCGALMKNWLIDHYGTTLYFASAYVPCSANDLMNVPAEKSPYSSVFISLSRAISSAKLHRYSADEIRKLNSQSCGESECKICGRTSDGEICRDCAVFVSIGKELVGGGKYIAVTKSPTGGVDWELPSLENGSVWLNFTDDVKSAEIIRFHTKNDDSLTSFDERFAGDISVGDYCYDSDLGRLSESAREADGGIKRIAVCRADVDNLGAAFISGFTDKNAKNPAEASRYVNLARTAAFSRKMSLFFKRHINEVLSGDRFEIGGKSGENRVNIVYSGGDDVFLVGVWDDVIESAVTLRDKFIRYCCGALTISAGIGIFRVKHPISDAAGSTAELEDAAKSRRDRNGVLVKDAVALFDTCGDYIFSWDEFTGKVINEKLALITEYLSGEADAESERHGKAMLYKMLSLCRNAGKRINIAKLAYLLARMEPSSGEERHALYKKFTEKVYAWAAVPSDRRELCMAIGVYAYLTRQ